MQVTENDRADTYLTVANELVRTELKVKGSRFICHVMHTTTRAEAEDACQELKSRYYDATHNCFAYRITTQERRYSDDGEPSGTAGQPIMNAIESFDLFEVLVVVTR